MQHKQHSVLQSESKDGLNNFNLVCLQPVRQDFHAWPQLLFLFCNLKFTRRYKTAVSLYGIHPLKSSKDDGKLLGRLSV